VREDGAGRNKCVEVRLPPENALAERYEMKALFFCPLRPLDHPFQGITVSGITNHESNAGNFHREASCEELFGISAEVAESIYP
jgi:hypothetical protein